MQITDKIKLTVKPAERIILMKVMLTLPTRTNMFNL